ncbi:unnamed protein product [Urochloa decumbens]|uniref:Uncharacterized protein n=1 Tax=Urochloa decumbens TaxID=240449 RepID=A0ABC9FI79_9POAL
MAGYEKSISQWTNEKQNVSPANMDPSEAIEFTNKPDSSISCQQLLMKASQGLLPHMDLMCILEKDYSATVNKIPADNHHAGIDSEQETDGYESNDGYEDEGYGADEEEPVDNFCDQYRAIDDYICQFDDTITKDDFYNGRDSLEDYIERGIDDTDMTGIEVDEELTESSTILDVEENNCALADTESSTTHLGVGGCGCAHPELAQEISQKHIEEVALGYKKRNKKFKDDSETDCRTARDIGAIEIAMRTRCHRKTEHIFEPSTMCC